MKNNSSLSGNVGVQVVAAVLSVIAIILGIAAIQAGNSSKKAVADIEARLESELTGVAQLENEVRQMKIQTQNAVTALSQEIMALKDQMTKKPEPVAEKKGDAKKDDAAPTGPGTYHTVQSGDLLGRIAKQYGTTVDAIQKLNPNANPTNLKIGQKIRVK